MPRKRKKKVCEQCGEEKIERGKDGNFYKITRFRTFNICKACVSLNAKLKRRNGDLSNRICKRCGIKKPIEEFISEHANSVCKECKVVYNMSEYCKKWRSKRKG